MASRIILGIDPGTTITGYGIIRCEGRQMEMVACGVIRLGRQQIGHPEKLHKIFERVTGLIQEFKPGEMALEAPFYAKNVQSMLKLGRAQGVAIAAGMVQGLEVFEYAPRKVKLAVTGRGAASKEQVCGMLEQILHFNFDQQYLDASDALAVAVCHHFQSPLGGNSSRYGSWSDFVKAQPGRIKS